MQLYNTFQHLKAIRRSVFEFFLYAVLSLTIVVVMTPQMDAQTRLTENSRVPINGISLLPVETSLNESPHRAIAHFEVWDNLNIKTLNSQQLSFWKSNCDRTGSGARIPSA